MTSAILASPPIRWLTSAAQQHSKPAGGVLLALCSGLIGPVIAGPVLCTTTLEAGELESGGSERSGRTLVEVTRCGPITTDPQLMKNRFYSYTSPYARGIDLTHQITDLFGIAMGGGDGTKVMGFGFIDQTMTWDGSAVENTMNVLLENQYDPTPFRTRDLPSVFNGSDAIGPQADSPADPYFPPITESWRPPVRGLW